MQKSLHIVIASGCETQGSGDRLQFLRKARMVHVDTDAGDENPVMQLNKNARTLLSVNQYIVRPAQIGRDVRDLGDRLRCSKPERKRDQRKAFRTDLQSQNL